MYHFYIDGSCKFSTGATRVGFALTDKDGVLIWEGGQDTVTGSQFEDHALLMSLEMVEKLNIFPVIIHTDALSNAIYLNKALEDGASIKQRPLMDTAVDTLKKHKGKIIVKYLPREYNFLADQQAQKAMMKIHHTEDYINYCVQQWQEEKKCNVHFFTPKDSFLMQKKASHSTIKKAWENYHLCKKEDHDFLLVLSYQKKQQVIPQVQLFNRDTKEITEISIALQHPDIYNRNTALSYIFSQCFDVLEKKNVKKVDIDMSHSNLSRIFQAHEIVGKTRYPRYLRIFKEFQRLEAVKFVFSSPEEKEEMGITIEKPVKEKKHTLKNFMDIHTHGIERRKVNYSKFACNMAGDILEEKTDFDWKEYNKAMLKLIDRKMADGSTLLRLEADEVRDIVKIVSDKKTFKL